MTFQERFRNLEPRIFFSPLQEQKGKGKVRNLRRQHRKGKETHSTLIRAPSLDRVGSFSPRQLLSRSFHGLGSIYYPEIRFISGFSLLNRGRAQGPAAPLFQDVSLQVHIDTGDFDQELGSFQIPRSFLQNSIPRSFLFLFLFSSCALYQMP